MLSRGWHIDLVADGLLRTDPARPPTDRIHISDFQASDPALHERGRRPLWASWR
jgi:hypothetical protein